MKCFCVMKVVLSIVLGLCEKVKLVLSVMIFILFSVGLS